MPDVVVLYFAYGSNLSKERMRQRIGRFPESQRAELRGYRLAFNKGTADSPTAYANIVPDPAGIVWGAAYECSEAELKALDGFEGVSGGDYERATLIVALADGRNAKATAYVAGKAFVVPERAPDEGYLRFILDGARSHRLPEEYVRSIERLALPNFPARSER
jgi:gamma-glutamylcyclotransferase (GGCT)/AIG2-like uncharacterized protein YtfP